MYNYIFKAIDPTSEAGYAITIILAHNEEEAIIILNAYSESMHRTNLINKIIRTKDNAPGVVYSDIESQT